MAVEIKNATLEQLDYAVAVAQGWSVKDFNAQHLGVIKTWDDGKDENCFIADYHPTTDQSQAGDLKTKYLVETYPHRIATLKGWAGKVITDNGRAFIATECETWMVAVVKAVLYSVYKDGVITVMGD